MIEMDMALRENTYTGFKIASLVFAAGRGSRMKDVETNKTLLPLVPGKPVTDREKSHPIIYEIIKNLPPGPKAVVVHYKQDDVRKITEGLNLTYCEQKDLNGTGGALLAARDFLINTSCNQIVITMGDVPFVKRATYDLLTEKLQSFDMVVLGFEPEGKQKYGVLETKNRHVIKITEWKYWKDYPKDRQDSLTICNSGIYAIKKRSLLHYLDILRSQPHTVYKNVNGKTVERKEYFLTDIIEYMHKDGLSVGYVLAKNTDEVMGVDTPEALARARTLFRARKE
jgi:bifunctional UDP-N-acetylglucosamine pyrophosphorylase/glucosamine-1-phosphate N-acetyltransferase